MTELNILVLDDEKRIREELTDFLEENGYRVFQASKPSEAMSLIKEQSIDIAIVDINLPERDGLAVLREIKEQDNNIEVLIITGQGDMDKAIEAMRSGAADFFNKPVRLDEVSNAIERTKRYINLSQRYNSMCRNFDRLLQDIHENLGLNIVGKSRALKELVKKIESAAGHPDTAIMITGESGTGKELVARSIHYLSSRKGYCFHTVNCAALPENLFESEFFGYVKGAFTGAVVNKPGWFEIADKGTLFLDEIGDMQPFMQAKLLRITEDGKLRRLGSTNEISVDVRLITATNRSIRELVEKKLFRQDLYHRINTLEINIPPLRERKEDIPELIDFYIKQFADKTGKEIRGIETALMNRLTEYYFPGNVRELKNMVERAVIICNGTKLQSKHFALDSLVAENGEKKRMETEEIYDLELIEKDAISRAMKTVNNNKLKAAKLLKITWQALERRLKKYNLQ